MKVRRGIAGKLTHCGGEIWVVPDYIGYVWCYSDSQKYFKTFIYIYYIRHIKYFVISFKLQRDAIVIIMY